MGLRFQHRAGTLSREQAAALYQIPPACFDRLRAGGNGPRCVLVDGERRYTPGALEKWLIRSERVAKTSGKDNAIASRNLRS